MTDRSAIEPVHVIGHLNPDTDAIAALQAELRRLLPMIG